ncbi:MAG: hypothetical protein WAV20_09525 [Blastocatellia bacterium]
MLRILIITLLAIASFGFGLNPEHVSGSPAKSAPERSMHVTVSFAGLMVFHGEASYYDVGILVDPHHTFAVTVDGVPIPLGRISPGETWTLAVAGSTPDTTAAERGHTARYPDSPTGLYDLSWMVDFDALHKGFKVRENVLYPIIRLNNGVVYSRTKTEYMERFKGGRFDRDFGFLTETVALDVIVPPRQSLTLKKDGGGEIFPPLDNIPGQPVHEVVIGNSRHDSSPRSDFRLYYKLFSGIARADEYDFDLEERRRNQAARRKPLNPAPRHTIAYTGNLKSLFKRSSKEFDLLTCCGYECNPTMTSMTPLR